MSGARGRRLSASIEVAMQALNASVDVDSVLWEVDIRGSKAHAQGLQRVGLLSEVEAESLLRGLDQIAEEIRAGEFAWDPEREDVHMNIEARLIEVCGPVGGKLHTGRSRNDQVATDLRLWAREACCRVETAIVDLAFVLLDQAEAEIDTLMPAYTHLQPAQPSRLSHHLMAWQELLWRDRDRVAAARERLNECPLGSGAVAGTGFPLDRHWVAHQLEFSAPMRNSLDATASRDFLMEVAAALAILGVHLSRIGEEVVLWSSREVAYLSLSDGFSTSSSMMPQKKNPDVAELIRGKSAIGIGALTALLVLEKSLPFGYGRDLQEDKRPIFDAVQATILSLNALTGALATATFGRESMELALSRGHLCATDLADFLAQAGVPFREAHAIVGGLVREAEARGVELDELPKDFLESAHPILSQELALEILEPRTAVERRKVFGGPAKVRVLAAIEEARRRWGGDGSKE